MTKKQIWIIFWHPLQSYCYNIWAVSSANSDNWLDTLMCIIFCVDSVCLVTINLLFFYCGVGQRIYNELDIDYKRNKMRHDPDVIIFECNHGLYNSKRICKTMFSSIGKKGESTGRWKTTWVFTFQYTWKKPELQSSHVKFNNIVEKDTSHMCFIIHLNI